MWQQLVNDITANFLTKLLNFYDMLITRKYFLCVLLSAIFLYISVKETQDKLEIYPAANYYIAIYI